MCRSVTKRLARRYSARPQTVDNMRRIAFALFIAALPAGAFAQSRPMTQSMTCGQARQLVNANGAFVLGTGQYTYDRYVRDLNFCEVAEYLGPAFVPTRDNPQCFVGYRCLSGPNDLFGD